MPTHNKTIVALLDHNQLANLTTYFSRLWVTSAIRSYLSLDIRFTHDQESLTPKARSISNGSMNGT